jgi:hypothetical protein
MLPRTEQARSARGIDSLRGEPEEKVSFRYFIKSKIVINFTAKTNIGLISETGSKRNGILIITKNKPERIMYVLDINFMKI